MFMISKPKVAGSIRTARGQANFSVCPVWTHSETKSHTYIRVVSDIRTSGRLLQHYTFRAGRYDTFLS